MYLIINNKKYKINDYSNIINKTKGLMFKKEKIKDIYLFKKCNAIHTFFMKQNIDICMIDKNNKIIYLESNVKKNKIIIKKEAYSTLECPLNTIKYLKLEEKIDIII